jgi:Hemerythrin HHE cation binding domain
MPDVFQVLKADHDTVKAMLDQLEDAPPAAPGATAEQLASRRETVDLVIIEETRHEAAEQEFLWPALARLGADGARVTGQGREQEAVAEPLLADLKTLLPEDPRFEARLSVLISAVHAHILFQETHVWPLLRASVSAERAEALGGHVIRARELASAGAQPHVPRQSAADGRRGPLPGLATQFREAVTNRGQTQS